MKLNIVHVLMCQTIHSVIDRLPGPKAPEPPTDVAIPTDIPHYLRDLHGALTHHLTSIYQEKLDAFFKKTHLIFDDSLRRLELDLYDLVNTGYTDQQLTALYFTKFDKTSIALDIQSQYTQLTQDMNSYFNMLNNQHVALQNRANQQTARFIELTTVVRPTELNELCANVTQFVQDVKDVPVDIVDENQLQIYLQDGFDGKTFSDMVHSTYRYPRIQHFTFDNNVSRDMIIPQDATFAQFTGRIVQSLPTHPTSSAVYCKVYGMKQTPVTVTKMTFDENVIAEKEFTSGYIPVDPNYTNISVEITSTKNLTFSLVQCSVIIVF